MHEIQRSITVIKFNGYELDEFHSHTEAIIGNTLTFRRCNQFKIKSIMQKDKLEKWKVTWKINNLNFYLQPKRLQSNQ